MLRFLLFLTDSTKLEKIKMDDTEDLLFELLERIAIGIERVADVLEEALEAANDAPIQ